ncbi:hypothetical protein GGI23_000037 [Coemansia sp. RSA 2559]|nr:hypothetical protein GGI23_000037 [Coemansia sp. RSA 2559]KAJ2869794.1 hypothetical protein GGI22_000036 [Coemansia erecta]
MLLQILSRKARLAGKVLCSRVFLHEALRTLMALVSLVAMAVWMIVCQQWSDIRWLQRFERDEVASHHHKPPAARLIRHMFRALGLRIGGGHHHQHHIRDDPAAPFKSPWPQYALLQDQVLEHLPRLEKAWISDQLVSTSALFCVIGCLLMSRGWRERLMVLRRIAWMVTVLYFLRSITISVTTMPPPRPACDIFMPRNIWEILKATPQILAGTMSQCTDDMFSGHTVLFTLSFLYLRTYATHWAVVVYSAVHAVAGILSVLLARYHYTVDVVVAVLLTYFVHRTYYAALDAAIWRRRMAAGEVVFVCHPLPPPQQEMAVSGRRSIEDGCAGISRPVSSLSALATSSREPSLASTMATVPGNGIEYGSEHAKQSSKANIGAQATCSTHHSSIDLSLSEHEVSEYEMQLLDHVRDLPSAATAADCEAAGQHATREHIRILGTSRPVGSILPAIVAWMDGLDLRY